MTRPWPEVPTAGTEQLGLPLDGTLAGRFVRFRESETGQQILAAFVTAALRRLADGRDVRAKACWEEARDVIQRSADNSFTGLAARWAEEHFPDLRGRFEMRKLTAD